MKDVLRSVSLLADMSDADLDRLVDMTRAEDLSEGTTLFREGDTGDAAYIIEAGEIEILKRAGEREMLLAVRRKGEVIGEISLLEDAPRMATARARCDARVLVLEREALDRLVEESASAARVLFEGVLARWQATTAMLKQGERMAQLGTFTAGIAHELNNPAAAVARGADQLRSMVSRFGAAERRLGETGIAPDERLNALADRARDAALSPPRLDALERADREAAVESWLDDRDVADPWDVAPALVSLGLDTDRLDRVTASYDEASVPAVVEWLASVYEMHSLLAEVGQGAARLSEIVKALKTYSFLDQAPVQSVDLHEGLDSTLLILRSKLKEGIQVDREYADDLPRIEAYGSELNQVWTNLLDNAIDALDGAGTITVKTRLADDAVEVEIEDDGPGIPEEIRDRIFDPFFTTKPPGKGTGLGLDISYNIVANHHRGDLKVSSRPGSTRFIVRLPRRLDTGSNHPPTALSAMERPDDDTLLEILRDTRTLAVVGAKDGAGAPAHDVPKAAMERGYTVIPVNPTTDEVLGTSTVPDLRELETPPDVVLIFRRPEHVPGIVEDAIAIGADVVWMQEGIVHEEAAERARAAGLRVVMDTCWKKTMNRLLPD